MFKVLKDSVEIILWQIKEKRQRYFPEEGYDRDVIETNQDNTNPYLLTHWLYLSSKTQITIRSFLTTMAHSFCHRRQSPKSYRFYLKGSPNATEINNYTYGFKK